MQTTIEQVIEAASHLSSEEIHELGKWVREKESQVIKTNGRNAKLEEELRKYKLATQWVEENRDEYIGKWVCLDGDKLISFGEDGVKVHREAKAKGVEIPFVVQVIEEPKFYGGGIEMCQ